MSETITQVTEGSIFDDAAFNFPPDHRIKAELVDEIGRRMATDALTQAAAATRMDIAQPDLSNILRGKFRGCSVDRLTGMLSRLGYGVDIVLRPPERVLPCAPFMSAHDEASRCYVDYERIARDMAISDVIAIETGFAQVHVFWSR